MSDAAPLATFEFRRGEFAGSHLSLFSTCLVHRSADRFETIPLDRVASLGAAFERDASRIAWGSALASIAIFLLIAFWPLRVLLAAAAGEVSAQAGGFLPAAIRALDLCVSLLPVASVGLAIWAAAWLTLGWVGETVLRVATGAGERVFATRGKDPLLVEFAESVAARIAGHG